ncbi:amino acid ABC transporter permease [Actinoplanes couchii]|uniref:Amino acid ABC transporter n=1 Tax=Actinoplanes couchii TaxID=403638 RepID=A0ABQ3XI23_9ACTN|nr:amino acid ABC transporter permease [Actinoplanes couchii]MDR6324602.1 His/Glu/Gln/Arg/opine family amino acid ABC transporter permease subunit [Actinoplanes couchii]GID58154.1 amino acid ABC transporter [Actinoplanes couchii]
MEFDSTIFFDQLLSEAYVRGALLSLGLAVASQAGAVVIGFGLALGKSSKFAAVRSVCTGYIWFFRAIPALLLLLLMWNGLPQLSPVFQREWYSPFLAAFIGLALAEGAFMAEIIRSALMRVDDGQQLAARALGMTRTQVLFKVVLPQATRVALPPTGNEFIGMVKYTSLASVISLQELLTTAQMGVAVTFRYAEYYAAATVYYLVIVSVLMLLQNRIERRFTWTSTPTKRRFPALSRPQTPEKVPA